ncbi:Protein tramtrack, alpha isoform [Armadillidium nasatum]|uniref:Protein tramtrack, alpha isoform n=1 Tax=Armadillidium nasatum TaxID=96803 RepID=A0A5N5SIN6_9CRUS|nr:Protein tramtrack, alpha isoform [Armadillidium nasatum]
MIELGGLGIEELLLGQRVSGSAMAGSPQQFCLRWNNHQSNIVTVFEQLLHSGAFVDVTLAVEGMSIKAHKVVLSACSPYFQYMSMSKLEEDYHPNYEMISIIIMTIIYMNKHPIVILKDVRYEDMRDLLDFMYRGEVSVDQDNLSGFLRVAESLRIKGLTEVNEKKRMETNSSSPYLMSPNIQQQNSTPPGVISPSPIIPHSDLSSLKRPPLSPTGSFGSNKRRRGRPPKISGEESEGEMVSTNQGASATDGEESRTDIDVGKDVKVEVEEMGKEEILDEVKEKDGRNSDSAGPSAENHSKQFRSVEKKVPIKVYSLKSNENFCLKSVFPYYISPGVGQNAHEWTPTSSEYDQEENSHHSSSSLNLHPTSLSSNIIHLPPKALSHAHNPHAPSVTDIDQLYYTKNLLEAAMLKNPYEALKNDKHLHGSILLASLRAPLKFGLHGVYGERDLVDRDLIDSSPLHYITVHTDRRAHKCHVCGKEFKRKDNMMSHIRSVHRPGKEGHSIFRDVSSVSPALSRDVSPLQEQILQHVDKV